MIIEILPRFWITNDYDSNENIIKFYKIPNIINCSKDMINLDDLEKKKYLIKITKYINISTSKLESVILINNDNEILHTIILIYFIIYANIPLRNGIIILSSKINDTISITKYKNFLLQINTNYF